MSYKQIFQENTGTHYLTTVEWNGMPEQFSYGSNETGIRNIKNNVVDVNSFQLIQHGWNDYLAAHEIIKKGLRKGWSARRIAELMDFLRFRKAHRSIRLLEQLYAAGVRF